MHVLQQIYFYPSFSYCRASETLQKIFLCKFNLILFYFSITIKPFDKYTMNDTHGGALQAVNTSEIDFMCGIFSFTTERFPQISILGQTAKFT